MSEDCDDDEGLESVLKDFINIKNTGTACKVSEARKFYVTMLDETKNKLTTALGMYLLNMNQKIPYSKLEKKEIDTISDDGEYMIENITMFNGLMPLVLDLYKNPKSYNAWKGTLKVTLEDKIEEQIAYYVELKTVKASEKEAETLYI